MQSINLFIYGTIKLQKGERWQSENFIGKLHLKKQIKIELIQRLVPHKHEHKHKHKHEHEHKHGFIN